jgi:glycosyltransferase involved in cell wall biosynthesis
MAELDSQAVCIIAHSHPDFSKGGGELAAHRQFVSMREAGRPVLYVGASEVGTAYAATRRIETVLEHAPGEWVYSFAGMAEDRLAWADPGEMGEVLDFLAGLEVGVFHFHHYWRIGLDLIVELMERRPDATFVITLHEMLAICMHHGQMIRTRSRELCRRDSPLRCLQCFPDTTLERYAFRKATFLSVLSRFDHVIYPSEFIAGRYRDWGLATPRASVLENYLGDDLLALPRAPGGGASAASFGFFGQPTAFKGLDVLLRALPLALRGNEAVTLTIYGAERADVLRFFPDLEKLVDDAEENLSFAGRYDPTDAVELMRSVGWIVVPSIWWENSPVVIQEARRAGTPLIVSDIGGMAEKVLDGVDGLHFKRGSPVDLARAMLEAADPTLRLRMGGTLRDVIGRAEFLEGLDAAFAPSGRSLAAEAAE